MDAASTICYRDLDIKLAIGNLMINMLYINYEPPVPLWHYGNHTHSSYELHFIPSGRGTLIVSGETYELGPGTLYLTGPDVYHEQIADKDDPMSEYCINFEFKLKKSNKIEASTYIRSEVDALLNTLMHTQFWIGADDGASSSLFESLLWELQERHVGYYTVVQCLSSQVIIHAVRFFQNSALPAYTIPKKTMDDARRDKVDNFFISCELPLKSEQLARQICVSSRQLDRIVRDYYGMSFIEKLNKSRLEKAKQQLVLSKLSCKQIALNCGFSSLSHFSKVFKRWEEKSPTEFRRAALSHIQTDMDR